MILFNSRKLREVGSLYILFNQICIYITIKIKKIFDLNIPHFYNFPGIDEEKCKNCGSNKKTKLLSKCIPDYKIDLIPYKFQKKIYIRSVVKCKNCGLIQDLNQMRYSELIEFIDKYGSKDNFLREEAWKSFPIPVEVKKEYYDLFWKKRFLVWDNNLQFSNAKKILYLRPNLGFVIDYIKEKSNAENYFLDISEMSRKEILQNHNDINELKGNLTYIMYGEFLKYTNYFDLIISHHTFVHVYDISDSLNKCKSLLNDNGKFIFTDEILFKPWNPFHYNYWTENVFYNILKKHFTKIDVLNYAGFNRPDHIKNYTNKGDNPDFICHK